MRRCAVCAALILALLVCAAGGAADRTLSGSGTIVRIDAKARTFIVAMAEGPERTFVWTPDTRITGTMVVGARVTLRYTVDEEGKNVALQINVTRS